MRLHPSRGKFGAMRFGALLVGLLRAQGCQGKSPVGRLPEKGFGGSCGDGNPPWCRTLHGHCSPKVGRRELHSHGPQRAPPISQRGGEELQETLQPLIWALGGHRYFVEARGQEY